MKIYAYHTNVESFKWFDTVNDEDILFDSNIDGKSLSSSWHGIQIKPIVDTENNNLVLGDFVTIGTGYTPILSEETVEILKKHLSPKGEFLIMPSESTNYYVFNVTNSLDVLDEEKSVFVKYDEKVARITHFHFNERDISNEELIFKIPQLPLQRVFVTGKFVELVEKFNLKGIACELVWDNGPLPINPDGVVIVI